MTTTLVRLAFAGIRSRLLATTLTILLAGAAAATIVLVLEVRATGSDPWQRTFDAAHGAHVLANVPTREAAEALRGLDGVTESADPVPEATLDLRTGGGREPLRVAGLSGPPAVNHPIATAGSADPRDGVVLERSLARVLGLDVGDRLVLDGPGGRSTLVVVGTAIVPNQGRYPRSNPGFAWVGLGTLDRLQPDQGTWRWDEALRVDDPATAGAVADSVVRGAPPGTVSAETWREQRDLALQEAAPLQLVLSMYTGVLLVVVFVVVGILVGARVLEQNREIGLLKAVGLTPRQVTSVFVIESAGLGVVATGLGYVVGSATAPLVAGAMAETMVDGPVSAADPVHLLVAGGPVLMVLVASTWAAARRRTRMSVLNALSSGQPMPPRRSTLVGLVRLLPLGISLDVGVRAFLARRGRLLLLTAAISLTGAAGVFALSMQTALDDRPAGEPSDVPVELPALVYALDAVLLLIALTSLVAVALLSVRERLRELGVLKAVGLTPRQVAASLVSPFGVLAGVAGVVSVPLGLVLYAAVYAVSGGEGRPAVAPWSWLLLVPVVTVALVVIATSVPARVATRSPAAAALRME
ncbi:MAG TPA: FtsX-like permease family protein [Nocardioides sp.]|uniref:ABC transporter permease n=1 Tax=Nocardioides sp. TaxID=35761 RepID=UPI002E35942D|nr:FtsX-like permease family protein [Nocardioides sp.]HEX5090805.1 FtsX-like permease family protein [Nocardioides sp.]